MSSYAFAIVRCAIGILEFPIRSFAIERTHVTWSGEERRGAERSGEDRRMANKEKEVAAETVTIAAGHGGRAEPTSARPLYALTAAGMPRWRLAKKT